MAKVTMRELLQAGVHFGHRTRYWNPKMKSFIYGSRNKIHIVNLEKTLPLFNDALNYLSSVAARNGKVLFVGTKRAASTKIKEEATRCGQFFVDHRWLGGTLTNYKTIRQSIKKLKDLEQQQENGTFERLTKKEALLLSREMEKLERGIGGIKNMGGLPDVLFVIDADHEKIAVAEANKLGIPVIAVVDSNSDPDGIDYIIPGNDDAIRAISMYLQHAADTILEARAAHAVANAVTDEFIEEAPAKTPTKKVTTRPAAKKIEKPTQATEAASEVKTKTKASLTEKATTAEVEPEKPEKPENKVAPKKAAVKKTTSKKAPAKKETESKTRDKPKAETKSSTDSKATSEEKVTSRKPSTKKATTQKTEPKAKKTTVKKTAATKPAANKSVARKTSSKKPKQDGVKKED